MTENVISSVQNPRIKRLLLLQQKSAERRRQGVFVVEGRRELQHCMEAGYEVESLFWCATLNGESSPTSPPFCPRGGYITLDSSVPLVGRKQCVPAFQEDSPRLKERKNGMRNVQRFEVTERVYEKIAYRGTTEGMVAIVRQRPVMLSDLQLPDNPLLMVLEGVEKPGNLGAVLRSADAAKADAVIVCDPLTDLYNPNLIRSSIGAVFTVSTVACTSEECIRFLQEHGIQILTAQLQDSRLYYDTDMRKGTALVMGTESTGLTDQWRKAATAHIRIPMLGRLDSLNVSVSAAILLFEAVRQRTV